VVYNGDQVTQLLQIHGVRAAADPVTVVGRRRGHGAPIFEVH
jgi:hypothetical protein